MRIVSVEILPIQTDMNAVLARAKIGPLLDSWQLCLDGSLFFIE